MKYHEVLFIIVPHYYKEILMANDCPAQSVRSKPTGQFSEASKHYQMPKYCVNFYESAPSFSSF